MFLGNYSQESLLGRQAPRTLSVLHRDLFCIMCKESFSLGALNSEEGAVKPAPHENWGL